MDSPPHRENILNPRSPTWPSGRSASTARCGSRSSSTAARPAARPLVSRRSPPDRRCPGTRGTSRPLPPRLRGDQDRGLREHLLVGEDRQPNPHRERDRIRGSRGDLEAVAVALQVDRRVEGALAQLGDDDAVHLTAISSSMFFMRSCVIGRGVTTPGATGRWPQPRPRRSRWQVPLTSTLPQQHDRLVRRQLDAHAGQFHLDHGLACRVRRPPARQPQGAARATARSASGSAGAPSGRRRRRCRARLRYRSRKSNP